MTTNPRQAHEADRIRHRFGRVRAERLRDDRLALTVIGDGEAESPLFRLILDEDGRVLERIAQQPDPLAAAIVEGRRRDGAELDDVVLSVLRGDGGWLTSRTIAMILDEDGSARVAASLRRLFTGDYVESQGLSRDKQWRIR